MHWEVWRSTSACCLPSSFTVVFCMHDFHRDFIMDHYWVFESFEASIAWPLVLKCRNSVHNYITEECKRRGIKHPPLVMTRLTQVYDTGAVLYFYFGFNWKGIDSPMKVRSAPVQRVIVKGVSCPCAVLPPRPSWMSSIALLYLAQHM